MATLDASALLALLHDDSGAAEVAELLRDPATHSVISAMNLAEAIDIAARVQAIDADAVHGAIDLVLRGGLHVVPVTEDLARAAGSLRARRYQRRRAAVSIADCIALETARADGSPLVTSDRALVEVCRLEGVGVIALPDSTSGRPRS